jgi:ribosomal protein S18 acetylase RimI-like enzyme
MMASAGDAPRRAGTIWVLDLDDSIPVVTADLTASFCRASQEAVPALAAANEGNTPAVLSQRFERGLSCYIAWVGGNLAAYGWVSFDEEHVGELNLRIRLAPGEAYIWDCVTLPEFRKNHLYSALLSYIVKELRADNYCRVWIGADLDNLASQRGIERAGFKSVADLVVARVFAMRQVWALSKPGVPDALVAEARRVFLNSREKLWLSAVN